MKALVVIAHGSRKQSSNQEVENLCSMMNDLHHSFDLIRAAFLELADPQLPEIIGNLAQEGAQEIRVLPYFLAAGVHVSKDLPKLLDDAEARYPNISFHLLPHLGSHPSMANWLLEFAKA